LYARGMARKCAVKSFIEKSRKQRYTSALRS
jgi:hypothetical protein